MSLLLSWYNYQANFLLKENIFCVSTANSLAFEEMIYERLSSWPNYLVKIPQEISNLCNFDVQKQIFFNKALSCDIPQWKSLLMVLKPNWENLFAKFKC